MSENPFNFVHSTLIITELASALCVFVVLFFIPAPYGRHFRKGWGFPLSERFAWMFMESPALILIPVFFACGGGYGRPVVIVFALLWELHYVQRTLVYPVLFPDGRKIFPLSIACMAFAFNAVNGCVQGYGVIARASYELSWFSDPRFIIGAALFFLGYFVNLHSDGILRRMRRINGEGSYAIPRGGLFRFISCPNYLGEISEWIGWAMATWSIEGAIFAAFTLANLFPRAIANHEWYKRRFPQYPADRKAIVPFII